MLYELQYRLAILYGGRDNLNNLVHLTKVRNAYQMQYKSSVCYCLIHFGCAAVHTQCVVILGTTSSQWYIYNSGIFSPYIVIRFIFPK